MGSDSTPTNPAAEHTGRTARKRGRASNAETPPAIDALSEATDAYVRSTEDGGRRPPRPSVMLAAIAGIAVGLALALAGRLDYRCGATLRIVGEASPAYRAMLRHELSSHAWKTAIGPNGTGSQVQPVGIESPSPDELRLSVIAHSRKEGLLRVRRIAEGCRERARALAEAARVAPTEAENVLSQYLSTLRQRLDDARDQVDAAIAALPEANPSENLKLLIDRWELLRDRFDTAKQQLSLASADLAELQSASEPTHGIVSAGQRRQAQEADEALQQDLRELAVNLTELKLHLLTVWQQSGGALDRLKLAADDLVKTASNDPRTHGRDQADSGRMTSIETASRAYTEALDVFAEGWNREFTALRQLDVDPLNGEVLDVYYSVQRRLGDFLFHASKRLSTLRAAVDILSTDPRDTARHHVFQSDLVRAFQTMQAGHHRFEFALDAIEIPQNFRLDASIKSARGLRRRSQERIRGIERRLQAQALKRAKERRGRELASASELVESVRTATAQTIDGLLALQDELNPTATDSDAFFRAVVKAEIASARLEITHGDLDATEQRLRELAAGRIADSDSIGVEIVSCEVVGGPTNLGERLSFGGLGAVLTFLAVLLTQWWMIRRSWSPA